MWEHDIIPMTKGEFDRSPQTLLAMLAVTYEAIRRTKPCHVPCAQGCELDQDLVLYPL